VRTVGWLIEPPKPWSGQEAGICTRTASFTGRDAPNYTTIVLGADTVSQQQTWDPGNTRRLLRINQFDHASSTSSAGLESSGDIRHSMRMSSVKEIESALTRLSLKDLQAERDWLDEFIEDQLEVSDEFKEKIQRAKQEIADRELYRK